MKKKGQITFYIIIGVLILLLFGMSTLLTTVEDDQKTSSFTPVDTFIDLCLKQSAEQELRILGLYGGDIDAEIFLASEFSSIPIFSENHEINKEHFLSNLTFVVNNGLNGCFNNFESLKKQGFVFEEYDQKLTIDENLNVKLFIPFKVSKGKTTKAYSEFVTKIDLNLDGFLNLTNSFLDEIFEVKGIPLKFMLDVQNENGIIINTFQSGDYDIYTIDYPMDGEYYLFMFAVKGVFI